MIKIHAAQRLVVADADEAAAREFIKSVAGITVGKLEHTSPDTIRFTVHNKADFMKALSELTERYGAPDIKHRVGWSKAGKWMIDPQKVIMLDDTRYGGGHQENPYSISLTDRAHRETIHQFFERLAGEPPAIRR